MPERVLIARARLRCILRRRSIVALLYVASHAASPRSRGTGEAPFMGSNSALVPNGRRRRALDVARGAGSAAFDLLLR